MVPVVIGALGSATKNFEKWLEKSQVDGNVDVEQKNYLVGNSVFPKESFTSIRERSNLLALGYLLWPAQ